MTRIIGDGSLLLAFVLAAVGAYAAVFGVRRDARFVRVAEVVVYLCFGLATIANVAMIYGLVTHDFSISYVAQVGGRATPLVFSVASLWGALEGSLLFWAWILAGYSALVVWRTPREVGAMLPYATATLLGIGAFFYLLLTDVASPFQPVWPVPADGPGTNPLLQNHWLMALHPPLTYLGYVGMSVPFAFAIGSLLAGRTDQAWIRVTRTYMLFAWVSLSLAIVCGMWWAYAVLGWGGYWAWDPVENASLMPWLTATALIHSVMVEQRRGMLKLWNLSLIVATFILTILGTFLTRSGILSSVHAFAGGSIGYYFLAFLALTLLVAVALLSGRSGLLRSEGQLDSVASRETVFLVNNLLLVGLTFTVVIGTLFPLAAEAVRGVKVSVGAPFFNQMTLPFSMALLFLVGVGPALPWGSARPGWWWRRMAVPVAALVVTAVLTLILGAPSLYTVAAFGFAAFGLTSNVQEIGRPAAVRVRAHGESWLAALGRVIDADRHRYGGYIAHVGFIVIVVGIAASSSYRHVEEATIRTGETMELGGYQLRLDRLWSMEEPHRYAVGADLALSRDGRDLGLIYPRTNYYRSQSNPIPTAAVRARLVDLYVTLMAFEQDGSSATFRAALEPLVALIWGGSGILAIGALIAAWPKRRPARVARPAAQPVQAPPPRPRKTAHAGGRR